MNLLEELGKAAARGVEVTIITNAREAPPIRFPWQYKETNCYAIARYRAAGLDIVVMDCDGDSSWWELSDGSAVLAKGATYECQPYYHFDACLLAAEAALLTEAARRKSALISRRTT